MLVYDGDCAFCRRCARWAERRGVPITPWQALPDAAAPAPDRNELAAAAWWRDDAGRWWRGGRAIARTLSSLGGLWGLVGRVLDLPVMRQLADHVYAWIARNRHRMPG